MVKIGELQTTQDINQKFLIGELKGNEVWTLEEDPLQNKTKVTGIIDNLNNERVATLVKDKHGEIKKEIDKDHGDL